MCILFLSKTECPNGTKKFSYPILDWYYMYSKNVQCQVNAVTCYAACYESKYRMEVVVRLISLCESKLFA